VRLEEKQGSWNTESKTGATTWQDPCLRLLLECAPGPCVEGFGPHGGTIGK
jgi:hypothetical protein